MQAKRLSAQAVEHIFFDKMYSAHADGGVFVLPGQAVVLSCTA
jgi:hypothetical protein